MSLKPFTLAKVQKVDSTSILWLVEKEHPGVPSTFSQVSKLHEVTTSYRPFFEYCFRLSNSSLNSPSQALCATFPTKEMCQALRVLYGSQLSGWLPHCSHCYTKSLCKLLRWFHHNQGLFHCDAFGQGKLLCNSISGVGYLCFPIRYSPTLDRAKLNE